MKQTDIHLVSWNRPKMTELVIKAIHRNTKRENFRLVVLDNGSSGDTPEKLQNLADNGLIDEYVPIKTNLGLEAARNLLLNECTQSDRFVCVDNDCLPPPKLYKPETDYLYDWLELMGSLMDKYEEYAAISMRTSPMIGTGNIFEQADKDGDELVDFPHPGGSYRIMDTKLVYFVGGWSRMSPGRGSEETFICGKLRDAGFKTAFAAKISSLHLFGDSSTDNWGYDKKMKPEDSGHSDIWHPKFSQGDDPLEIAQYVGEGLTEWYL